MSARTAIILTSYNRPHLVVDAIESVFEQEDQDWRLYIMDDGSLPETTDAIRATIEKRYHWSSLNVYLGVGMVSEYGEAGGRGVTVAWGPSRSAGERKRTISYSYQINKALTFLLHEERYVTYLCDDDYFYPESVGARAAHLDEHPDRHVVFGRTRSVEYNSDGAYNAWREHHATIGHVTPGRHYPRPTGPTIKHERGVYVTKFERGELDPETGLDYVDEGFWRYGPIVYARDGHTDHNQVMHRRSCLLGVNGPCREWPQHGPGTSQREFWPEDPKRWDVGDLGFFTLLSEPAGHMFWGIDSWVCTKRFHAKSDGLTAETTLRE